jgi:hypothetical protein
MRGADIWSSVQYDTLRKCDDNAHGDILLAARIIIDALEEESTDENCGFIPVFLLEVSIGLGDGPVGLVLRRIGEREYSRLGVFEFCDYRIGDKPGSGERRARRRYSVEKDLLWFGRCKLQTITLV